MEWGRSFQKLLYGPLWVPENQRIQPGGPNPTSKQQQQQVQQEQKPDTKPGPLPPSKRRVTGADYGEMPGTTSERTDALKELLFEQVLTLSHSDLRDDVIAQQRLYDQAALRTGLIPVAEGESDDFYEGGLVTASGVFARRDTDAIEPIEPAHKTGDELLVFVNGMAADLTLHREGLKEVADASGLGVIGVHNATGGLLTDVVEAVGSLMGFDSGAVETTAMLALDLLEAKKPFLLVGHSQGGLILSRALKRVHEELREQGLSEPEALKKMALIQVETHGCTGFSFPDGPQYVHYHNVRDPIPSTRNRDQQFAAPMKAMQLLVHTRSSKPHLGKDAVIMSFDDTADGSAVGPHRFHTYLAHRVPFDEARARGERR